MADNKRREPLTVFAWSKAENGTGKDGRAYEIAGDKIRRCGGVMRPYNPVELAPHRVLIDMWEKGSTRIECLDFVNEYGFLGFDGSGPDIEVEDLSYVRRAAYNLAMLWRKEPMAFAHPNDARVGYGKTGDDFVGPMARMFVEVTASGRVQLRYKPESLYAWMWLRVADELTNGVNYSGPPCWICHEPIGRGGPGGSRKHRVTCSDACRKALSRLPIKERKRKEREAEKLARSTKEANHG